MRGGEASDRFKLYLESNPALVVVIDREGRITELNPAGGELLGVDPAEVIGTDWFRFVPEEQREETRRVFAAVMRGELALHGTHENDVLAAGGARRRLLWRNAVVRDATGAVTAGISTGVDVTGRRELEERLARSEEKYRIVADYTQDWETWHAPDGSLVYCSPSCERITGHPAAAFLANPRLHLDIAHPDDAAMLAGHLDGVGGVEPECEIDFRIRTAAGEERWLNHRCRPVVDPAGRFLGRRASNRDVTDRFQAERSLRELFDHMSEGFAVHEILLDGAGRPIDYRFLQVNEAFERLTGLRAADVVGHRVREVIPGVEPEFIERYGRVARTGEPVSFELHSAPLGRTFQVHAYRPGPGRFATTFSDVTERRAALEALQVALRRAEASESLYRSLFDATPTGVVLTDAAGRIVAFNDRAASDLGYSREEFGRLQIWDIDATESEAEVAARAALILRDGFLEFEVRHRNRAGELRDVRVRAVRVDRPTGTEILAFWEDVTEQRRAALAREAMAEQLRESRKLESIGRLAGGVAHDINNMLVVLLGCADGLRRSLQEGRPPEVEDVDELDDGVRRARELTGQLLAYARRSVVAPVRVDLNEQVRQAERMLRRLIGENVRLELRLSADVWPTVVDPGQLSQVLVNLVLNARDAMPDGGRLAVATENVGPGTLPRSGWHGAQPPDGPLVRLTVSDSGDGIDPALGASIFEPFVTTKPTGKGTGLGLATAYGIVRQAGGALRYRSVPGQETVFEVLLPRAEEAEAGTPDAPAAAPARPISAGGGQVLLVEDDARVRSTVARALRQDGFDVREASSGEEALGHLRSPGFAPRILVTDVLMPGMNGRQVAEAVEKACPGIPVLFMSGYAEDVVVRHGAVEPGLNLIEKPFTAEDLLARVRGLIARP
ncbi:MAG TPA: PAS domain S-box protein [Anaeromyxobacteraceae bacterium]|nr:PAS domain S-box protein [Anaeromyxobacteraceae bacterium]